MTTPLLDEVPDACARLAVARSTLYKLHDAGEIEFVKVGRKTLVPVESMEDFVARLRSGAVAATDGRPAA